jgi:hypothetical protein
MDKVRKPNISVCYTPSSEPYSIYLSISITNTEASQTAEVKTLLLLEYLS